jgi:hypothetical protein
VVAAWGEMRGRAEPKAIVERLTTQLRAAVAEDARVRFERDHVPQVNKSVQKGLREKFPGLKINVK